MPAAAIAESGKGQDFPAKLTGQVICCSIIAAFGGLMFGYDIGISGGVTTMDDFLLKFFPLVYAKKHRVKEDNYCKYDNPYLQLFTSSLYLAAIVACYFASIICRKFGRKPTMQAASIFFLAGAILNLFAQSLGMLIAGRLLLGLGVGFGNQAVPLFISEIAPAKYRGGLNIMFQLLITIGILGANLINYRTSNIHPNGWRMSLGGAAAPALLLLVGSCLIVETPASLIERGKREEGRRTLQKIRGVKDVEKEFNEICNATELSNKIKNPFSNLMKRSSRPQLVCGTFIHLLQQFSGINVVMFYAPVLFQTMGYGSDASLLSAVVTGGVNVVSTLVAICLVDRAGRRKLLIQGAVQMIVCQCAIGVLLHMHLKATNTMPKSPALIVVILVVVFVAGFAWSWGPLCWLISSEIYPLETRNAGYFFAVSTNMIFTFIIAQAFLSMLCSMRSALFFFFSGWLVVSLIFVCSMLPETKGIPIDEMKERVWKKHWHWKGYFKYDDNNLEANKGNKEDNEIAAEEKL